MRVTAEWFESCSLAVYQAEVEERGDTLARRRKTKAANHSAHMARMALRLHRVFEQEEEGPCAQEGDRNSRLADEEATQQLEPISVGGVPTLASSTL